MTQSEINKEARVIKKYQNRKLYDLSDSRYVTLADIAEMIRRDEDVVVIDNETKEEVTVLILTQILYDQEKNHKTMLPISILRSIIQAENGSIYDFMHKYIVSGYDSSGATRVEATRYIDRLTQKGILTKGESKSLIGDLDEVSSRGLDALQGRINHKIETSLKNTTKFGDLQTTVTKLHDRINELEHKLSTYETVPSQANTPWNKTPSAS